MRETLQPLWAGGNGWILVTISCGWLISLGVRIVYPVLLPDIMAEFAIDYTGAGFLLSMLWIAYAAMQFPGGLLADRFGERIVLLVSITSALTAVLLIIFAPAFAVFAGATVLLGIGTGLYGPSRVTVLTDVFPEKQNTVVSFSQAAGNAGNAVLPVIAGLVSGAFGWRYGFGYLLPVFGLVFLGIFVHVPTRTSMAPENRAGKAYLADLWRVVGNRSVLLSASVLFFILFFYQGLTGFLPSYLLERKGLPQPIVTAVYGGFFATAIALQFAAGTVADRYGERIAIALFTVLGVVGVVVIPFVQATWAVVSAVILAASVLGSIPPANTNIVGRLPETLQGSGYGLLRSIYIGLAAGAPPIVGYMADNGFFDVAILFLGGVAFCGGVVCLKLPELD